MMEAALLVHLPGTWVSEVCNKFDTAIQFHRCVPYGQNGGRSLIEFDNGEEEAREMIEEIRKHPSIERVEVSRTDGGKISATVVNRNCRACQVLAVSDCFLVSAHSLSDGRVRWRLVTGQEGSLRSLVSALKDSGCDVEVERVRSLSHDNILTKRQEEVLAVALREGYYESPKRIYLAGLSKVLQVSPSTLGEILKRAERSVINNYLDRR
jgi:predicted DNA binding protein